MLSTGVSLGEKTGGTLMITVLSTVTDTVTPAPAYDGIATLHKWEHELQDSGDLSGEANQLAGGRQILACPIPKPMIFPLYHVTSRKTIFS